MPLRLGLGVGSMKPQRGRQRSRSGNRLAPRGALVQARLSPELARDLDRVDAGLLPPRTLIADTMNLAVMCPAQRSDEFVAHLPTKRTRLCEAKVVRIGRRSSTDKTRLLSNEPEMVFVAIASRLRNRKDALVHAWCGILIDNLVPG